GRSPRRRDDVRLGLPAELLEERIPRSQTSSPIRVIASNEGRIDYRLKIFQSDISPILIFSTTRMPRKFQDALGQKAVLHLSDSANVNLAEMLRTLSRKYNVRTLACEGGPTLFRAMLERGFIDE